MTKAMRRIAIVAAVLTLAACESVTSVRPYKNECHPDRYYTEMQDTTPELKAVQAWCKSQREGR